MFFLLTLALRVMEKDDLLFRRVFATHSGVPFQVDLLGETASATVATVSPLSRV